MNENDIDIQNDKIISMEKAEISRLINSFNAIKGYFDTTKRYMPQIAKLVFFIEEIIPLLNTIHVNLHKSTSMIPTATEKLDKVTSATEMAATEVMDIVDNVINRLNVMTENLDDIDAFVDEKSDLTNIKEKTETIRNEVNGSQDDLFSIMNALQFQDITTQQINSIASTIDVVHGALAELLKGFEDDGITIKARDAAFDPDAEFDFSRSAESQKMADEFLKESEKVDDLAPQSTESSSETSDSDSDNINHDIVFGKDGQPDINSILSQLNKKKNLDDSAEEKF